MSASSTAAKLHRDIAACSVCAEHLPLGPRPVVQFSARSHIVVIGQAPGTKVHASGIPWDDDSGDRLREWLGLDKPAFYDPDKVALVPMGFCYPGKAKGGDASPRPECAPAWHKRVLDTLPANRLTLLVGSYAQAAYSPPPRTATLTSRVRNWAMDEHAAGRVIPLPHPSWRVRMWMAKNPWFEGTALPRLRAAIEATLT